MMSLASFKLVMGDNSMVGWILFFILHLIHMMWLDYKEDSLDVSNVELDLVAWTVLLLLSGASYRMLKEKDYILPMNLVVIVMNPIWWLLRD